MVQRSRRKVALYEHSQYFLRSADRAVLDPPAPMDAQAEPAVRRGSIAKDVPVLRIDHVSTKGKLFGVRQALYSSDALNFEEMNNCFVHIPRNSRT
jgi:hypothetical protein